MAISLSRISTQLNMADLHKESLRARQLEAMNATILTYNHEINNAVMIAMATLGSEADLLSEPFVAEMEKSLFHISGVLKAIKKISSEEAEIEQYVDGSKMFSLKAS